MPRTRSSPAKLHVKIEKDDSECIKDIDISDDQIVFVKKEPVYLEIDVDDDTTTIPEKFEVNNNKGLLVDVNDEILAEDFTIKQPPQQKKESISLKKKNLQACTRPAPVFRRVHLDPPTKRVGRRHRASRFEMKHDTRLLDRFFIPKNIKTVPRRRLKSKKKVEKWTFFKVDEAISFNTVKEVKLSPVKRTETIDDDEDSHDETIDDFFEIVERDLKGMNAQHQPVLPARPDQGEYLERNYPQTSCETLETLFDIAFDELEVRSSFFYILLLINLLCRTFFKTRPISTQ